jgi:hypothetical protein
LARLNTSLEIEELSFATFLYCIEVQHGD